MTKSDSIAHLAEALAKAQGEIKGAIKDADNPFFNSRYADLASVWDACRLPLSRNGLSVVQMPEVLESGITVETMLLHASGEYIASTITMKPMKPDPQGIGSCVTYARRYALSAMVGIAPEDDDGNAASGRDKPEPRQQRRETASETARTQPAAEIPAAVENPPAHLDARWQDIICHVGKAGGEMKGQPLSELTEKHLKYLAFEWNPKKPTPADTVLAAAVKLALAEVKQGPELPMDIPKAETPAADDNLDLTPAPAKEAPRAEVAPPAIDWRSVVTHSIGKILGGKKLGDLAEAEAGQYKTTTPMDGAAILRRLASEAGIAMISDNCADEKKRAELIAAIRAAVSETKPYNQAEWLESLDVDGLREEVARRIAEIGVTAEAADKTLDDSGLEPVKEASEATLRHVIKEWETVKAALKGGE